MFVRVKTYKGGRKSVQIVKSERIGGKIKQTVVKHIGSAKDDISVDGLKKSAYFILNDLINNGTTGLFPIEAEKIEEHNKKQQGDMFVNMKNIYEEKRLIKGVQDVYGKLYDEIGFSKVFGKNKRNSNILNYLKQIVLARIASPKSKRASVEMLDRDYGVSLNLKSVYNMMEKIGEKEIDKIQEISYNYTKGIFKEKLDVLFLDGTTLYFESDKEDDIRKPGYGKEGKPQDVKVMLILFVTKSGLPVGYKTYPGNQYEGHTLQDMVEMIEKKYNIDKVFLAADSGFLNKDNLEYLNKKGHKYVIGARIKNLPKKIRDEITNKDDYKILTKNENGEVESMFKEFDYQGQRLIVTYKEKRANKDKKQREKHIETLTKKIGNDASSVMGNFGYKKYIKKLGQEVELDEDKIKEAEKRDGLKGIITNDKSGSVGDILGYYGGLRQVEESFRINKHDLLIRPIFHYTEQKIRAHIAISYIAFTIVRHLEYRVKLHGTKLSPERIRQELLHVQGSILVDKSTLKKYFIPSKISGLGESIYKAIGLKHSQLTIEITKK